MQTGSVEYHKKREGTKEKKRANNFAWGPFKIKWQVVALNDKSCKFVIIENGMYWVLNNSLKLCVLFNKMIHA